MQFQLANTAFTTYNTFNIRTIYNAAQTPVTNCRGDLFAGTIRIRPTFAIYTQGSAGSQIQGRYIIQYRPLNAQNQPSSGWTEIATMAGSPNTWTPTTGAVNMPFFDTSQAPGTTLEYDFRFDQLGQYRVVVADFQNVGTGKARFYVNFGDGTYVGLSPQGSCTP